MITLGSRLMLLLTMLFALPILVIRAQPYDDHELRAFLTPPDTCPAPCFMGIRPGITTADEALAILEGHEWVAAVRVDDPDLLQKTRDSGLQAWVSVIRWDWQSARLGWIDERTPGQLVLENRVASVLLVDTSIPLGNILLAYGTPHNARLTWSSSGRLGEGYTFVAWYPVECIQVIAEGVGSAREVYRQPVRVAFQAEYSELGETMALNRFCGQ